MDTEKSNSGETFTIHTGSYEGMLIGFKGHVKKLENYYCFNASTASVKCLHARGRYLFTGGFDEIIRIFDLKKNRENGQLEGHDGSVVCLKTYDRKILFSGGEDGAIVIWRMKDWAQLHKIQTNSKGINDMAVHSSGKILISINKEKKLAIWNLVNAEKVFSKSLNWDIFKVKFSFNEDFIVLMGEKSIYFMSQESNRVEIFLEHPVKLQDILILSEKFLIAADDEGEVYIWDVGNFKLGSKTAPEEMQFYHLKFKAHEKRIKSLELLKREGEFDLLISASSDGTIKLWDVLYLVKEITEITENKDLGSEVKPVYNIETRERLNCMVAISESEYISEVNNEPKEFPEGKNESPIQAKINKTSKDNKRSKTVKTSEANPASGKGQKSKAATQNLKEEIFKPKKKIFKSKEKKFNSKEKKFNSKEKKFNSKEKKFKSTEKKFKSKENNFKSKENNFKSKENNFKSKGKNSFKKHKNKKQIKRNVN